MEYNLKNRPKSGMTKKDEFWYIVKDYEEWFEGFEKELRGIKKAVDEFKHNRRYMDGRSQTIKEILGE